LSENLKEDDGDPNTPLPPDGDDNPDISDYLGHYELLGIYKYDQYQITNMVRHNFEKGNGAIELGFSFPLWGRLRGFVQYFNGYGESMIDYNHKVQRIGLGILLTDLL
jgi:phospholipase A1